MHSEKEILRSRSRSARFISGPLLFNEFARRFDDSNSTEEAYPVNDISISMTSASLSVPSRILTNVENERGDYYETKDEIERERELKIERVCGSVRVRERTN